MNQVEGKIPATALKAIACRARVLRERRDSGRRNGASVVVQYGFHWAYRVDTTRMRTPQSYRLNQGRLDYIPVK
jgi:hypothetical protein